MVKPGTTVQIILPEPHYTLLDTERRGLPAVVVVNDAMERFEHREIFPWHLEVTIEARDLADNGMPARSEYAILDELGDSIEAAVTSTSTEHGSANVLFLARLTWNGQRELVYRVHDPELVAPVLERLVSGENPREWSYEMRGDEPWSEAEPLLDLLRRTRD